MSAATTTTAPMTIHSWLKPRDRPPPGVARRCCCRRCCWRRSRRVVTVIFIRVYPHKLVIVTVLVRFAPSPTGSLHIGSVRTTLYNYLFAKQHKGTLIPRIEDTDQDRLVEGAIDSIEDQILMKSDGYPTYHLAVVVDDHEMAITHIFRGEDWLPSTPKHLLIYQAFGWNVPPTGHFPNVLGPDNKKLSKRHGATKVEQFRADGYLPEAMANYLALIGWSPGTEDEIFTLHDLVERFRIDQVQKAGGRWDKDRLDWFDGVWIRRLSIDELVRRLDGFIPVEWDRALLRSALPLVQERAHTLVEMRDQLAFLFGDELRYGAEQLVPKGRDRKVATDALLHLARALRDTSPFRKEELEAGLRAANERLGWKMRDS